MTPAGMCLGPRWSVMVGSLPPERGMADFLAEKLMVNVQLVESTGKRQCGVEHNTWEKASKASALREDLGSCDQDFSFTHSWAWDVDLHHQLDLQGSI